MARSHESHHGSHHESHNGGVHSRPTWSGAISFGLVSIPVKLYTGVRNKDIRFHMLHDRDKSRLVERLVCPVENEEVPRQEAIKGYEYAPGQHIVISQEEIDSLAPKATRMIELISVVDMHQIDPVYFDRPFYLLPDEKGAKAYFLFMEALQVAKKGAIAKFVMRSKEYIGALRPIDHALVLDTLHFQDEVIFPRQLGYEPPAIHLRDAEIKMALQLLEALEGDFKPSILHNDFREDMMKLIQRKAAGEEIVTQPPVEEEEPRVIDLMSALKRSITDVQRQRGRKAA